MAIQLNEIKECFGDFEKDTRNLAYHPVSADEAYERLRIMREVKNDLKDNLNKHVRTIPTVSRVKYERLFETIEELINEECYNVRNGD